MMQPKKPERKYQNPDCPNCRGVELGIMDVIGMPSNGLVYACKSCGEMFVNDVAQKFYDGRFAGKSEFWMNELALAK